MLFNPSNSTTGFLLQTMLYVANITKNDLNRPKVFDDFKVSPMGADSGEFPIFSLALGILTVFQWTENRFANSAA